jgi:predicted  nucleic acid-binding Zn-ribbon protein
MRLNDALKDFRKAQSKLKQCIQETDRRIEKRREQIEDLTAENRSDETEKLQAEEALDQINALVGAAEEQQNCSEGGCSV